MTICFHVYNCMVNWWIINMHGKSEEKMFLLMNDEVEILRSFRISYNQFRSWFLNIDKHSKYKFIFARTKTWMLLITSSLEICLNVLNFSILFFSLCKPGLWSLIFGNQPKSRRLVSWFSAITKWQSSSFDPFTIPCYICRRQNLSTFGFREHYNNAEFMYKCAVTTFVSIVWQTFTSRAVNPSK